MENVEKKPLYVIAGPTASGKTACSIALAKEINGEIISADSMQIYKYMDIGSAKIMPEEMEGIKHYLVDELEPGEAFSVMKFQQMAKKAIKSIYAKGKVPIIVGGTGFYIQSVIYDIDFTSTDKEKEVRKKVEKFYEQNGIDALYEWLQKVDIESTEKIHKNNVKRVKRAIEFYELTGEKISTHNEKQQQKKSPYDVHFFVLTMEREILYDRINLRVDKMLEKGLIEEVTKLRDMGCTKDMVSMQGLGYKEILDYLEGEISLEEAIYLIKRDTRHFAKRQCTWFKREKEVQWIDVKKLEFNAEKVCKKMLG